MHDKTDKAQERTDGHQAPIGVELSDPNSNPSYPSYIRYAREWLFESYPQFRHSS